ncbi:MAG TPA: HAMP domain-containing sensor histidine kinase [Candidatus Limnocylindria bacterium]|nr:HAMP domain-containing sensor histidine kinase [Candidatus Limnocylindria bacterium]
MIGSTVRGLVLGLALVGAIGFVDFVTGPDYGFAFFYFTPIIPVAWRLGLGPGLIVAVASAAMWFGADAAQRPEQALAPIVWNALSRLAIFVGGALLIDRVRTDRGRMARIDAERDQFLRVLEHELPVPAQEMVTVLNEAQASGALEAGAIDALRHRAESLLFLTRDFVALGRAQASRLPLRSVPVDIAQLVAEISRERPDRGSLPVTVPGDGLVVMADPDRLRQALANTIAHVVSDAGAIDYVSINVRARADEALVSVSAAMPAGATRSIRGADLRVGMQLARLLVEAMGGSVDVERVAIGRGSRVTLRLPNMPAAAAAAMRPADGPNGR